MKSGVSSSRDEGSPHEHASATRQRTDTVGCGSGRIGRCLPPTSNSLPCEVKAEATIRGGCLIMALASTSELASSATDDFVVKLMHGGIVVAAAAAVGRGVAEAGGGELIFHSSSKKLRGLLTESAGSGSDRRRRQRSRGHHQHYVLGIHTTRAGPLLCHILCPPGRTLL